ncbi:MAG TPA: thioredoxin-disulfide reductase [Cytophagaceae bacterium]|jgi:thioredoxin reductase (NADPH)|nr:thioredoxin-disulfide reductase [Cytophagaceae bacterium]
MSVEKVHCLIIGSGPAGYTAAIYAARAGMKPLMYAGSQPGGQLMITNDVENYPGYPKGVNGPLMMEDFRNQALRFGTDIRYGLIDKVDLTGPVHKAWADDGKEIHADAVIIATGASAKWLGIPSEDKFKTNGGGVTACAVCDGFFYKGMEVAVVGAGDTACEEAAYLAKICKKVYMIVRRDEMKASQIMQNRVRNIPNIEILWNSVTDEILGDDQVVGVRLKNTATGELSQIEVKGFFVAIGHEPNSGVFIDWLDMDNAGYINTSPGSTRTNIEGVFACGDVQDTIYRQAITAAGSGCMAALDAERYLAAKEVAV